MGELEPIESLPAGTERESLTAGREIDLRPPLLTAALLLALVDLLIAYALRGLLRRRPARLATIILLAAAGIPAAARADDAFVVKATSELRLAYIRTGNQEIDAASRAGLIGLTGTLNRRTAVETAEPLAVDVEQDELVFFPLALLAGGSQPGGALAEGGGADQPLSRNRRDDPVRHAGRQ